MTEYRIGPTGAPVAFFGRTLYDSEQGAMFFNWSMAGFTFAFFGSKVEADVVAYADTFPGEGENLPWVAVFVDEQPEPYRVLRFEAGRNTKVLFESDLPAAHVIRVVKRSENSKGRQGLISLRVDGPITAAPVTPPRVRIEFIGDSITCGFGNEMGPEETVFDDGKENALAAYPAITAGLLGAVFHCVCISGIPLCWASDPAFRLRLPGLVPEQEGFTPPVRAMDEHYAYADRNHEESMGKRDGFTPWDFNGFQPDAVVVNLGTNDAFRLRVTGCTPAEESYFIRRYTAFLMQLRKLNGPAPVLMCTLGSMDYYLYDAIEKAVAAYRTDTGDMRVATMKFAPIDPWGEGYGGLGHPNVKTQIRMGHELAAALKPWLSQEGDPQ